MRERVDRSLDSAPARVGLGPPRGEAEAQLYLSGGVATSILRDLHMSFTYYVNISVVGYPLGAAASVIAGLGDRYGRANIVTAGLGIVGLLCLVGLPNAHTKQAFAIIYIAIGFVEGIILFLIIYYRAAAGRRLAVHTATQLLASSSWSSP